MIRLTWADARSLIPRSQRGRSPERPKGKKLWFPRSPREKLRETFCFHPGTSMVQSWTRP